MPPSSSGETLDRSGIAVAQPKIPQKRPGASSCVQLSWWRRACSFPVFLAACLVGGAFIACSGNDVWLSKMVWEGDLWWHLAAGERILATLTFPRVDPYSYTAAGTPWIAYGWLHELLLTFAERLGGLQALGAVLLLTTSIFLLLLYYYGWLRCRNHKAAVIACACVLPLINPFISLRPQLPGFIFLLLTLICLEHFQRGTQKALWFLPAVFVLWANTHASFVFGLAAIALHWATRSWNISADSLGTKVLTRGEGRHLAMTLLLCVIALGITPYGSRLATYPLEFSLNHGHVETAVGEWLPLVLASPYGQVFMAIILLLLINQVIRPVRFRVEELLFFVIFAFFTGRHARFLVVFALAATPMVAAAIARYVPEYDARKDRPWLNAVLVVVILAGIVALFPTKRELQAAVERRYPEKALAYLQQSPPVRLWNDDAWGGYLIWRSGGKLMTFIDGRLDIYDSAGVLADYDAMSRGQAQMALMLRRYNVDTVLLPRNHNPIESFLRASSDWQPVYEDDCAVVFRRPSMVQGK